MPSVTWQARRACASSSITAEPARRHGVFFDGDERAVRRASRSTDSSSSCYDETQC
jgi:hypothetical protein